MPGRPKQPFQQLLSLVSTSTSTEQHRHHVAHTIPRRIEEGDLRPRCDIRRRGIPEVGAHVLDDNLPRVDDTRLGPHDLYE